MSEFLVSAVINQAIRYVDSWQVGDGPNTLALAVLAELRERRCAVVELPSPCTPPSYWDGDCLGAWEAINLGADPVSAWPNKRHGVALPDGAFISADAARDLAGALLAAADAAEAFG